MTLDTTLRPRSIGEILDRGLTIFIRRFWQTSLIVAPAILIEYLLVLSPALQAKRVAEVPDLLTRSAVEFPVWVLCSGAFAYMYWREALAQQCSATLAFRTAFLRYLPLLGTHIAGVVLVIVVVMPLLLIAAALLAIGNDLGRGVLLPVAAGIAVVVWAVASIVLGAATLGCVCENLGVLRSLRSALRLCVASPKRALVMGLVCVAPTVLLVIVDGQLHILGPKWSAASTLSYGVLGWFASGLRYAWVTAYWLDARVRFEGLDLQVEAKRLG